MPSNIMPTQQVFSPPTQSHIGDPNMAKKEKKIPHDCQGLVMIECFILSCTYFHIFFFSKHVVYSGW